MAFDGKIMNLDSGAENLFDIKAETVIAGNQKLHSYLPHITIPDIDQNITEKVSPQLKVAQSNLLIRNGLIRNKLVLRNHFS